MMYSQSLMVIDGVLKLGYVSAIFVNPGIKIDGTITFTVCCTSGLCYSIHIIIKTIAKANREYQYSDIKVSQGKVVTRLRCSTCSLIILLLHIL